MADNIANTVKKNWFQRHKKLSIFIGVIVVLYLIGTVGGSSDTDTTSTVTTEQSESSPDKDTSKSVSVNEPATIEDTVLTVTNVQRNFTPNNPYIRPESGKEYVIVTVQLENKSDGEITFNTYDFKMQDSNGVQLSEAYIMEQENRLSSGSLAAGGKINATLGYQVPNGDSGLKLIFKPNMWNDKTITVKL